MTQEEKQKLDKFIKEKCPHPRYDTCFDTPCPHASIRGCQHPDYPKELWEVKP